MKKIVLILSFFLVSCGYKPVSHLTKELIAQKVYVDVKVSLSDPANSVLAKDAVLEAVVSRFGASISNKQDAQTLINIKVKSINFNPIIYDQNGYVISYKTELVLAIDTIFQNGKQINFDATGEYDFSIEANSIISDSKRFEAIKNSSLDALNEYFAYISTRGTLWQQQ